MKDLNYELKQLCRRSRDGSYATQDKDTDQMSCGVFHGGGRAAPLTQATADAVGNARRF